MYPRKIVCFTLLLLIYFSFNAGAQSVYSFQQDDSVLKRGYYQQTIQKKEKLFRSFRKEYAADYGKVYEEQFREIGELWQSSRAVTAPAAHSYLQALVTEIISHNPSLRDIDARVVFSRDWWPNAYSMGEGSIAVNAGLFVYLNNEAELAFIICHELAHYYLDHSGKAIQKYVETINSSAYQAELKRLSRETYRVNQQLDSLTQGFLFSSRRHTRAHEAEADRLAFSLLKNTRFDCNGIKTCLQLLDKIDSSALFQPLKLDQVFNSPEYPFRKKWIQKETMIFSELGENESGFTQKEKDSLKTHPDCEKRIALLNDSLQQVAGKGVTFLVDEQQFRRLKEEFFFEISEQCFREKQLSRHLYYSLLLLQSPIYKETAIYSVTRCLNLLYDKQKEHQLGLTVDKEEKGYPEEYNLLLRMLDRLRLDEFANINYQFCVRHAAEMKNFPPFIQEARKAQQRK